MNDIFTPPYYINSTFAPVLIHKSTNQFNDSTMKEAKRLFLSFFALLASTIMYAQTEISGTVIDATGETVIGATVMEKGTSNGTITDFDGNFKIKVNPGATLVFSYIGYNTQELPAQDGMQVTMKDNAKELAEVVVTGYSTQRKADLTGSVSVVETKDLKTSSDTDPMRALQGKVPGMTITSNDSWYRFIQLITGSSVRYRRCAHNDQPEHPEHERYRVDAGFEGCRFCFYLR